MPLPLPDLSAPLLGTPAWTWLAFGGLIVTLLAFDLGVLHRRSRVIGAVESLWMSAAYITIALGFGGWVWYLMGQEAALLYTTGFLVEKTLALDNVFVISLIFAQLAIPPALQHRVLFWGVLGAIVMRAVLILLGATLVTHLWWVLPVFGLFLIWTGAKMLLSGGQGPEPTGDGLQRWLRRILRVTPEPHDARFLVRLPDAAGRRVLYATPLLLALIMVEAADLVFAVDSVPAVLAITTDPFLVITSNVFAILGLRALYFALAASIRRFTALGWALALVLIFIGGKILWSLGIGHVDPALSLGVTVALLAGGVLVSLLRRSDRPAAG
ncbi:TerC family protein [Rhodovastum atsumiense]|uniref:TerC family protein n=1 Tax=Rhodovastum atsumiense TaxID=504468 RepID=A0A5M6IQA9_9PROT|nr:TerC family protein [Rhodovastum atsumiense]